MHETSKPVITAKPMKNKAKRVGRKITNNSARQKTNY
jgi:hypothetical protein